MDASQLSDLSGKMEEEEEMFTPSECSSELEEMITPSESSSELEEEEMFTPSESSSESSSELEEMFDAPSEMPGEQSVTELAHDDVGIIEKSFVSPKNREGMPTGSGILDEYSTSSVANRLSEANIADEISPPPHAVKPLSPEASKDSEDINQLDIQKGQTAVADPVANEISPPPHAVKPLSPEASKDSEDLNQLPVADQVANKIPKGPLFQIMKIASDKHMKIVSDKQELRPIKTQLPTLQDKCRPINTPRFISFT